MITGKFTRAKWGDEEVEIPPLRSSNNGWYYGYDGETLARGEAGRRMATDLANARCTRVLADHDWEVPDEVYPVSHVRYSTKGLVVWFSNGLGVTSLRYDPGQNKMEVTMHPVLKEIAEHRFGPHPDVKEIDPSLETHEVAKNIWAYGRRMWPVLTLIETPTIEVKWSETSSKEVKQADGSYSETKDTYSFFRSMTKEQLELARGDKIEDLVQLFKVFGHTDIRTHTAWSSGAGGGYGGYVTTGIDITVKDPEHHESHTVQIKSSGEASVTCGYRESEKKYLEYQKRELAGWMQDELGINDEGFTEMTFD